MELCLETVAVKLISGIFIFIHVLAELISCMPSIYPFFQAHQMKVLHRMVAYILNNAQEGEVEDTRVKPNLLMANVLLWSQKWKIMAVCNLVKRACIFVFCSCLNHFYFFFRMLEFDLLYICLTNCFVFPHPQAP